MKCGYFTPSNPGDVSGTASRYHSNTNVPPQRSGSEPRALGFLRPPNCTTEIVTHSLTFNFKSTRTIPSLYLASAFLPISQDPSQNLSAWALRNRVQKLNTTSQPFIRGLVGRHIVANVLHKLFFNSCLRNKASHNKSLRHFSRAPVGYLYHCAV